MFGLLPVINPYFRLAHSTLRMIQAVIREKPEDPLDFMISFIDTC